MRDPKRWLDDPDAATDEERSVLRGALDVDPRPGEDRAVWLTLASRFPAGTGGGGVGGAPGAGGSSGSGGGVAAKATAKAASALATAGSGSGASGPLASALSFAALAKGTAAVVAMGGAAIVAWSATRQPLAPTAASRIDGEAGAAVALAPPANPGAPVAPALAPVEAAAKAVDVVATTLPTAPPSFAAPPTVAPSPTTTPVSSAAPTAGTAPTGTAPTGAATPAASPIGMSMLGGAAPTVSGTAAPTPTTPPVGDSSESPLRAESEVLRQARDALRLGDAATCLARIDDARARFPHGMLEQEREALRVEALYKNGDKAGATAAGNLFLRAFPESPHASRVRSFMSP